MAISLQDQLLKSGLTNKSKANQSKKEKYKQSKEQRNSKTQQTDEVKLQAEKKQAEQKEKDLRLNRQRKEEADKKAIQAQIKQLIKLNLQKKAGGEEGVAYNFTDDNKVKTIYISEALLKGMSQGRLAIVRYESGYEVVPKPVAEKIIQRDESFVVLLNAPSEEELGVDDPYAEFQIPDDLMW